MAKLNLHFTNDGNTSDKINGSNMQNIVDAVNDLDDPLQGLYIDIIYTNNSEEDALETLKVALGGEDNIYSEFKLVVNNLGDNYQGYIRAKDDDSNLTNLVIFTIPLNVSSKSKITVDKSYENISDYIIDVTKIKDLFIWS